MTFGSIRQPQVNESHGSLKPKAQNLAKTWLKAGLKVVLADIAFLCEKVLIDLFIKYNTAIPYSVAVECLYRARRATVLDANYERLTFIKGNQCHIEATEKEQKTKFFKAQRR